MDAIIRAARMDENSPRILGKASAQNATPESASSSHDAGAHARAPSPEEMLASLRDQVEAELRREMADEVARAFTEERERGRKKGYDEGHAAGLQDAIASLAKAREQDQGATNEVLEKLATTVAAELAALDTRLATLTFEAVCRLLGKHALDVAAIKGTIASVLSDIRAHGSLTVRMHPSELSRLQGEDTAEAFHLPGRTIRFVADDSLTHGGCIVDTDAGRFDGSLDTQLKSLHQALNIARSSEAPTRDA